MECKQLILKIKNGVLNKIAARFISKYEKNKNKKYRKVRDNCHYTREYKGVAHRICNLKYIVPKKNPIVFRLLCYHKTLSRRI